MGSERFLPSRPHSRRSSSRVRSSSGRRGTSAARIGRSSTRRWIEMALSGRAWREGRCELLFGSRRGRLGSSQCLRSDGKRRYLRSLSFLTEECVSTIFICQRARTGSVEGARAHLRLLPSLLFFKPRPRSLHPLSLRLRLLQTLLHLNLTSAITVPIDLPIPSSNNTSSLPPLDALPSSNRLPLLPPLPNLRRQLLQPNHHGSRRLLGTCPRSPSDQRWK